MSVASGWWNRFGLLTFLLSRYPPQLDYSPPISASVLFPSDPSSTTKSWGLLSPPPGVTITRHF